jgi:hypothetical protein
VAVRTTTTRVGLTTGLLVALLLVDGALIAGVAAAATLYTTQESYVSGTSRTWTLSSVHVDGLTVTGTLTVNVDPGQVVQVDIDCGAGYNQNATGTTSFASWQAGPDYGPLAVSITCAGATGAKPLALRFTYPNVSGAPVFWTVTDLSKPDVASPGYVTRAEGWSYTPGATRDIVGQVRCTPGVGSCSASSSTAAAASVYRLNYCAADVRGNGLAVAGSSYTTDVTLQEGLSCGTGANPVFYRTTISTSFSGSGSTLQPAGTVYLDWRTDASVVTQPDEDSDYGATDPDDDSVHCGLNPFCYIKAALKWAFVPGDATSEAWDSLYTTFSTRAPGSLVVAGGEWLVNLVGSWRDATGETFPMFHLPGIGDFSPMDSDPAAFGDDGHPCLGSIASPDDGCDRGAVLTAAYLFQRMCIWSFVLLALWRQAEAALGAQAAGGGGE